MGMFDNVKCEYPLPDSAGLPADEIFQTKSFGDGFTGGFLDDYTITKDGKLIWNKKKYEYVEEEDRPYYGKPEWDRHPLYKLIGSMKGISEDDVFKNYTGVLNMYSAVGDTTVSGAWYEYNVVFVDGNVTDVERIRREFGA